MKQIKEIIEMVESLKIKHFVNDSDGWYSCPKSGECYDERRKDDLCDCGADSQNKKVEDIVKALNELIVIE